MSVLIEASIWRHLITIWVKQYFVPAVLPSLNSCIRKYVKVTALLVWALTLRNHFPLHCCHGKKREPLWHLFSISPLYALTFSKWVQIWDLHEHLKRDHVKCSKRNTDYVHLLCIKFVLQVSCKADANVVDVTWLSQSAGTGWHSCVHICTHVWIIMLHTFSFCYMKISVSGFATKCLAFMFYTR